MKNGLPYYKAYPRDFIEGTIGMPFEVKCAYRVVLDMIYMQGGELPDDARYISGLLNCSIRKWNTIRDELVKMGKLRVSGKFLTNYRADKEIETLAKLQDKQRENATGASKNKDLPKATATPPRVKPEPEPEPDIEEKEGGGGSASAKIEPEDATDDDAKKTPSDHPQQSHREQILAAIGVDPVSGLTGHGGGRLGTQADMAHAERWTALGLPPDDQLAVVAEVMARKSDGPPSSFRFFDKAMERLAGARAAGPLAPQAPVPGRAQPPPTAVKFDLAALLAKHPELDR